MNHTIRIAAAVAAAIVAVPGTPALAAAGDQPDLQVVWDVDAGVLRPPGTDPGLRVIAREPGQILTRDEPQPLSVALVQDLGSAAHRVGPGDTRPVYLAIRNDGNAPLTKTDIALDLPRGSSLIERYRDCGYGGSFQKGNHGTDGDYLYYPAGFDCLLTLNLQPGQTLPLFDPATGASLINVKFGRNLSGPDDLPGYFSAGPSKEPQGPDNGSGPYLADLLNRQPTITGPIPSSWPDLHSTQGQTAISVFTRPNTYDLTASKPVFNPIDPNTLAFSFNLLDNGPSDIGEVEYTVTAPKGTVLTQGPYDQCHTQGKYGIEPESAVLVCKTRSPLPTVYAALPPESEFFILKIKSTPGRGGKITVRGTGVGSTESNWSNNTVPIVLTPADLPPQHGGGGLPITGAPVAIVAGTGFAVVLLGLGLLIGARRPRRQRSSQIK